VSEGLQKQAETVARANGICYLCSRKHEGSMQEVKRNKICEDVERAVGRRMAVPRDHGGGDKALPQTHSAALSQRGGGAHSPTPQSAYTLLSPLSRHSGIGSVGGFDDVTAIGKKTQPWRFLRRS